MHNRKQAQLLDTFARVAGNNVGPNDIIAIMHGQIGKVPMGTGLTQRTPLYANVSIGTGGITGNLNMQIASIYVWYYMYYE